MKAILLGLLASSFAFAADATQACTESTHKVEAGDTLSKLSILFYNDWRRMDLLVTENKIKNADHIEVGEELKVPCLTKETPSNYVRTDILVLTGTTIITPSNEDLLAGVFHPTDYPAFRSMTLSFPDFREKSTQPQKAEVAHNTTPEITTPTPTPKVEPQPRAQTQKVEAAKKVEPKPKPAKVKTAKATPKVERHENKKVAQNFETFLHIPQGTVNGIAPGNFPALYLIHQNKNGEWKSKEKTTVKVGTSPNGFVCRIVLDKEPLKNSSLVIDWGNGNSLLVTSDMLRQGGPSKADLPKKLGGKRYKALAEAFPTKSNPVVSGLRFVLPTAMRTGLAFVMMGPMGLVSAPGSVATDLVMMKLRRNQRHAEAPIQVQYAIAGQEEKISAQEKSINALQKQIAELNKRLAQFEIVVEEGNQGQGEQK